MRITQPVCVFVASGIEHSAVLLYVAYIYDMLSQIVPLKGP